MTVTKEGDSPATLDDAKKIVESEFLGIAGIHGVGKKHVRNLVRVYAEVSSPELSSVLNQIKSRCSPFDVEVIVEEKPTLGLPQQG